MATPLQYPLTNGSRHEWSSIEVDIDGVGKQLGFSSINYTDKLEPTLVYGISPEPIGQTRGVYSAEGDFELYEAEFRNLVSVLGDGWKEKQFGIRVSYAENGLPTVTDELIGCRIKQAEKSQSQGSDPLKIKCTLSLLKIKWGAKENVLQPLAGVPA